MVKDRAEYLRRTRNLCTHLDRVIYKILSEDPSKEWELTEIQSNIEQEWGIRPYRATLLRHALNFYRDYHIPLFCKSSFAEDKYKLNHCINTDEWQEFFNPKPKGRPKKYTGGEKKLDSPY